MNPRLRTLLPRWVGMAASLAVVDGVDESDITRALEPEIAADLRHISEAEQCQIDHECRIVLGLFHHAMLKAVAECSR